MLHVSEVFESIQGEGINLGKPSIFLRLAHCNLHCVFCDTPYTWRYTESFPHRGEVVYDEDLEDKAMTIEQVANEFRDKNSRHVVVTGGEPMLQNRELDKLFKMVGGPKWSYEFETAGTILPLDNWETDVRISYVVSPKLENSGNELKLRYRKSVLKRLSNLGATFKFVVVSIHDFEEIDEIVEDIVIHPNRVYISPEGIDTDTLSVRTAVLVPEVIKRGYNLTTRLQILAWGNRRGV